MIDHLRGNETRDALLSAALDLFSRSGYDATSVAQICDAARVSKGAFYHHFPSKQMLFLGLMDAWLAGIESLFQSTKEETDDVPAALEGMALNFGQIFIELDRGFPILLEFWTQASRQPQVWRQAVAPYQQFLEFFTQLIKAGVQTGDFAKNLDPEVAARALTGMAMGLLLQASFDDAEVDWQKMILDGLKIFIDGIRRKQ